MALRDNRNMIYGQDTNTNNTSDDDSYSFPFPFFTNTTRSKSRLGKCGDRSSAFLKKNASVSVLPLTDVLTNPLAPVGDTPFSSGARSDVPREQSIFSSVFEEKENIIPQVGVTPSVKTKWLDEFRDLRLTQDSGFDFSLQDKVSETPMDLSNSRQSRVPVDSAICSSSVFTESSVPSCSVITSSATSSSLSSIKKNSAVIKDAIVDLVDGSKSIQSPHPQLCEPVQPVTPRQPPPAVSNDCFIKPRPVRQSDLNCIMVHGKRYQVLSELGTGGSSKVYQVLNPDSNESLAIKRVDLTDVDNAIAEGYINEVELLKRLQRSEFVVKMYDSEKVHKDNKKLLYVVMEMGDTDLSKLIKNFVKTKKLSIPMIIYYWTEMLSAVNEIHNAGIIHSDLKPPNFLLVKGRLKLIDFGIASSIQGDCTSIVREQATGTYNYMSPEALHVFNGTSGLSGFKISYRTDVWSLGCILYNMIYGKLPFQHLVRPVEKMQAIVDPKVAIKFPQADGVPSVLMDALKWCLRKNPKERPTVSQLLRLPYTCSCLDDLPKDEKQVKQLLDDPEKLRLIFREMLSKRKELFAQ